MRKGPRNPGSSPCTSLLLALNMACTLFGLTPEEALAGATRNAARALGLDCGPMSGFDNAKVDAEFFAPGKGNPPEFIDVKSNFLCNLGYGDESKLFPRNPRLKFHEACRLL